VDAVALCDDGENLSYPPVDTYCSAVPPLAWEFTPQGDEDAAYIELYGGGGPVALLDSAGQAPGAALWTGTLPGASGPSWSGTAISPPIHLTAGHLYFVSQDSPICSVATSGTGYPYYMQVASGWSGPYAARPWTFRIQVAGGCL
jgi:hypothetical protein